MILGKKRHYYTETQIRDAQKHYRGRSQRGFKEGERWNRGMYVLWVKDK